MGANDINDDTPGGSNPYDWAFELNGSVVNGWPIWTDSNDFGTGMNRISPRGETTEIRLREERAPVARTIGVLPFGAHVVPL